MKCANQPLPDLKPGEVLLTTRQIPTSFWVLQFFKCLSIVFLPSAVWSLLHVCTSRGHVTNLRLYARWGIFRAEDFDHTLDRIRSIWIKQGFMGWLLGYGHIVIEHERGDLAYYFTAQPFKTLEIIANARSQFSLSKVKI